LSSIAWLGELAIDVSEELVVCVIDVPAYLAAATELDVRGGDDMLMLVASSCSVRDDAAVDKGLDDHLIDLELSRLSGRLSVEGMKCPPRMMRASISGVIGAAFLATSSCSAEAEQDDMSSELGEHSDDDEEGRSVFTLGDWPSHVRCELEAHVDEGHGAHVEDDAGEDLDHELSSC
jgi:hypothetical protein